MPDVFGFSVPLVQAIAANLNPAILGAAGLTQIESKNRNHPLVKPQVLVPLAMVLPFVVSLIHRAPHFDGGIRSADEIAGASLAEAGLVLAAQGMGFFVAGVTTFYAAALSERRTFPLRPPYPWYSQLLGTIFQIGATFGLTYGAMKIFF